MKDSVVFNPIRQSVKRGVVWKVKGTEGREKQRI